MIEKGQIIQIDNDRIHVEVDQKSGCAHCHINHCCTTTGSPKRRLSLKYSDKQLKPGDWIEIETPARSLLSAALLVFILPLILSTAVYIIVMNVSGRSGIALFSFFACFIFSEGIVALIDRLFGHKSYFEPKVIKKTI